MRDVRQHGTRVLADRRTHLMGTSGFWQKTGDLLILCDLCEWAGWVEAIEDLEDMTLSYTCKGCGDETTELLGDRDDDD